MKAALFNPEKPEQSFLEIQEINKPQVSTNTALVKVRGVGVCGSDLLKLNQSLVKAGTVLGHELVAEISQISDELSQKYSLKPGDRIVSSHHVPCGKCKFCKNAKESLCTQFKSTNFYPGAFCEYLELSEGHLEHTVFKIPDQMSDKVASFTEPLACCLKAIKKSTLPNYKLASEAKVLVFGLGSIGLMIGQLVKEFCPEAELTACDLLAERQKLAQNLGFDKTVAKLSTEDQYDFIFLCAGAEITVELATKHACRGAQIVVFSSTPEERAQRANFVNNEIYYKELTVQGSYSPNLEDLKDAFNLLLEEKIQVEQLITHEAGLEDLGSKIIQCKEDQGIKTYLKL